MKWWIAYNDLSKTEDLLTPFILQEDLLIIFYMIVLLYRAPDRRQSVTQIPRGIKIRVESIFTIVLLVSYILILFGIVRIVFTTRFISKCGTRK